MNGPLPSTVSANAGPSTTDKRNWASGLVLAAVAVVAIGVAASVYQQFRLEHRALWYSAGHDRSAHYLNCLHLATTLRSGDVAGFLSEFNRAISGRRCTASWRE